MEKLDHLEGLRIAYFSYARLPSRSANSIHVMRMCNAFAGYGSNVCLYVPAFPDEEYEKVDVDVFEYYGIGKSFKIKKFPWLPVKGRSTVYSWMASLHAKLTDTQLVYARDMKSGFMCARLGLPVIFEAHAPIKKNNNNVFRKLISSKTFVRLVVISDALRKIFEQTYPELAGRIIIAHDAADIDEVCNETRQGTTDRLRIGYVGHLYQGRGIDLIIELARRCPWADFEIVGGMDEDVDFWKSRSEEINNIHFYGHLSYNQAGHIRQCCQILLAPFAKKLAVYGGGADTSQWMSPMKIFEYMAAGKAILCSDLPVLREVLENEKTALFCSAENVDDWQLALEKLRDDPLLMKRIGQQAREKLEKHHTWQSRAAMVVNGVIQ